MEYDRLMMRRFKKDMVILYIVVFLILVSFIVRTVELEFENRDLKKKLECFEGDVYHDPVVTDEGRVYQVDGCFEDYVQRK